MNLMQMVRGTRRARLRLQALLVAVFVLAASAACAQDSRFAPMPDELVPARRNLTPQRMTVLQQRAQLLTRISEHNAKCSKVPENSPLDVECRGGQAVLAAEVKSYQKTLAEFNRLAKETMPSNDPMVVNARVPRDGAYLTEQLPELKNSPAADRISKGFQAVINHDWPVALAWWQDALNRDPRNATLKRSVNLAQWMVDRHKAKAAGPVTSLSAAIYSASHGNSEEAIRQFELVKRESPAVAVQVDSMINELRQRQKMQALSHKNSKEVEEQIAEWDRQWVEKLYEDGMKMLAVGDERQAQWIFHFAESVSQKNMHNH